MANKRRVQRDERLSLLRFVARQEDGLHYDRAAPHHQWLLKQGYVTSKIYQPDKERWPEIRLFINDTGRAAIAAAEHWPSAAA